MEFENASFFEKVWDERDKRMDVYFILQYPIVLITSCSLYMLFALYVGPLMMKNRQPYNLRSLMLAYNLIMILINAYIHVQGWRHGWLKYKLLCQPPNTSTSEEGLMETRLSYYYLMTKFVDWIDTLFFILRKKFNQVSFLHVYHHTSMPLNTWPVVRFLPGGHMTFTGMINTLIHVVMHTYYALSSLGPTFHKYLWWKKYITSLQIFQFVFGMVYLLPLLMPSCGISKTFLIYMYPQGFLFLFLFGNFYRRAYGTNKSKQVKNK